MAAYTTIDDSEAHFQVKTYTGTDAEQAYTLDGDTDMQPDFVWFSARASARNPVVFDVVRGVEKTLNTNLTQEEETYDNGLTAFGSDGFTLGNFDLGNGGESQTYVAWCWKGGGSASSNSVGSIASSVSANTTSGFGIATYTGTGSAGTVGHGIGIVPEMIVAKRRDNTSHWMTYHHTMGNAYELYMNATSAGSAASATWNSTTPTATVSSVATDANNTSSGTFVNYLFAPVQGFSKFGTYEGNGAADGAFVYTGFRPAFVMTKSRDSTSSWHMFDNKREGYNVDNDPLVAEDTTVEATTDMIDLLSTGFKLRISTDPNVAETYVYAAFAEAPFVNSNGVPCNAR